MDVSDEERCDDTWSFFDMKLNLPRQDLCVYKIPQPCSSSSSQSVENWRKRRHDASLAVLETLQKKPNQELNHPNQPFLLSMTNYDVLMIPRRNELFYYPQHPMNYNVDLMAAIFVTTGPINNESLEITGEFFPVTTRKFLSATSANIICCAGSNAEWGLRYISGGQLATDLHSLQCTPKNYIHLANYFSIPPILVAELDFVPKEFGQALCLPNIPDIEIKDFCIMTCGSNIVVEENSAKPLKAILIFHYWENDKDLLQFLEAEIEGVRQEIHVVGGSFDEFGTSVTSSNSIRACGWKIHSNSNVRIQAVGINLSGWDYNNEGAWETERDEAIRKANLGQFFEGSENGFVFIFYTKGNHIKDTLVYIRRYITKIPTIGIQTSLDNIIFQGYEINVEPLCPTDVPGLLERRDIKVALLMVAY